MPDSRKQDAQVAKDLNKKLRLEATFRPEVRSIFARIAKDFAVSVAATGFTPEASKFKSDWIAALRKHYTRVQNVFTGVVVEQQKSYPASRFFEVKQTEEDEAEQAALLGLALQKWRDDNAEEAAIFITETTRQNFKDSIREARELIAEQGLLGDARTLAFTALVILKRKFRGREQAIVMFETQKPAESTKLSQAEVMAGLQPSSITGVSVATTAATKTWRNVGDLQVRPAHVRANFQKKNINEPFVIDGQRLMHPGDTSLGASLEMTANCRCSAQYSL